MQELGVWSESLPPAQTCGIGQKAETMLQSYRHVAATLEDLNTIRGLREALVSSKPPLQVKHRANTGRVRFVTT